MSLTIISQPTTTLLSANNNNFFVVSGTTVSVAGVTEYKYKADVFLFGSYLTTLTEFPDPTTNFGKFNLLNIPGSLVSYDFPVSGSTSVSTAIFNEAPNSLTKLSLVFYEEYVSGSTFITSAYGPGTTTFPIINSAFSQVENLQIDLDNYLLGSTSSKFLLTNQNASSYKFPAYSDLHSWLHFYQTSEADLEIITYDAFMTPIATVHLTSTVASYVGVVNVAVGIPDLSAHVDFSDAAYYSINLVAPGGVPISETIFYQVKENCGRFAPTSYKVYWLGAFGEINSWYFTKKNVITSNKTQSNYKKELGKLNSAGQVVQTTYDSQVTPFYTAVNDQIVLGSDLLSDQDVLFVKGLYQSPVVFMQDQNGIIQRITVSQNNYPVNKTAYQRAYALSLTVQTSITDYTQPL